MSNTHAISERHSVPLVEVHGLKRIVLIAHEGCAFYGTRLDLKERRMELVQRADLVRSAAFVRRVTGLDRVDAYYARLVTAGESGPVNIQFEGVEV